MSYTIKRDQGIAEITKECPRAIELLTEYGLACANCFLNSFDTVEAGSQLHGMSDSEINQMVSEINDELKKEGVGE